MEIKKYNNLKGQVMLIVVLALSATILGATTIAGLLTLYQIRQATDVTNSMKAIYAADAGIEWRLYKLFKTDNYSCQDCPEGGVCPQPVLTNGAEFSATCAGLASGDLSIKSKGYSHKTYRAFGVGLATSSSPFP